MENNDILKMYDLVFEDCVKCYLENLNDDEEEEEKTTLTDREIKKIAHNLIYDNDYLWETINETIDYEIGRIIRERKKEV